MLAPNPSKSHSLFDSLTEAVRNWTRSRRMRLSLDECDSSEVARMAREFGLSPRELSRMSRLGPDAADLLLQRMNALHLDPEAIWKSDPATMRDMQRLCSACASKRRCQRDLHGDHNSAWVLYCPNAGTLDALQHGSQARAEGDAMRASGPAIARVA